MLTFRNTTLNYYKSLDTLKILLYWKIIKEKNILLLDFDYYDGKKYTDDQKNELEATWWRLYDEFYLLSNDAKSKIKISKSFDELKLRDKITQIKHNYDYLITLKSYVGLVTDKQLSEYEQATYNRLKIIDKRIKPLYFEGIEANLKNLDRVLKSLINQYNASHKENNKEVSKAIENVYDIVASAESWLERSIPIDDMVCSHWIAIENQVKQKAKAVKNKNNGR